MRIGVPTEIKEMENRVGATPAGVAELVRNGHQVCVEKDAGQGSGFSNSEYEQVGAKMADTAAEVTWLMTRDYFSFVRVAPLLAQVP